MTCLLCLQHETNCIVTVRFVDTSAKRVCALEIWLRSAMLTPSHRHHRHHRRFCFAVQFTIGTPPNTWRKNSVGATPPPPPGGAKGTPPSTSPLRRSGQSSLRCHGNKKWRPCSIPRTVIAERIVVPEEDGVAREAQSSESNTPESIRRRSLLREGRAIFSLAVETTSF